MTDPNNDPIDAAFRHTGWNREEILTGNVCRCIFCLSAYPPSEIDEWIDEVSQDEITAICPICGIDSVLGDQCGFDLTDEFLKAMRSKWYEVKPTWNHPKRREMSGILYTNTKAAVDQKIADEFEMSWEAEATETYGPPEVRVRKNRDYAANLLSEHSESTIRSLLKAIATIPNMTCAKSLSEKDLDRMPLFVVIQPFELLGFHFEITDVHNCEYSVKFGEGYGHVGSGGKCVIKKMKNGEYEIVYPFEAWIA